MYYGNRIFAVFALPLIALAATYSIRLALADAAFRKSTPAGVERALRIVPEDGRYLMTRALQRDYDGEDATDLLARAARVSPVSSAPRIRLGLAAESRGDYPDAEIWLLDAARVDRQFEPRWTLANFYFRREQIDPFWKWMRLALDSSYGDRRLAFDLCWRVTQGANEILTRAIANRHGVEAAYLNYLLDQHREAAGAAAFQLAAWHDASDVAQLETACDLLIASGRIDQAQSLWAQMGHVRDRLIANGDFATDPSGHGFDWRLARPPGVTDLQAPGEHRILLSGKQPESCELLRQIVALKPGRRYSLRWEARSGDLPSPTGIEWNSGAAHAMVEAGDVWRAGSLEFASTAAAIPIMLQYQRPTGQARAVGSIEIRNVSLAESGD